MSAIAVILAIACCLAVAGGAGIADRPRRQRRGSAVAVRRGNHEDLGAGLNPILLNVAVVLAIVLAVLSTRDGSRAVALIIAHPEWLAPVDAQMLPAMSVDDAAEDPGP
jgi:hypothetical protein